MLPKYQSLDVGERGNSRLNVSTASLAGGDRMTSLLQSVSRGNADRCFAIDSADTVEPHERCWILIGLLVEAVT